MIASSLWVSCSYQLIKHHEKKTGPLSEQFGLLPLHSGKFLFPSNLPLLCFPFLHHFNDVQYFTGFLHCRTSMVFTTSYLLPTPVRTNINNGTYIIKTTSYLSSSFDNYL